MGSFGYRNDRLDTTADVAALPDEKTRLSLPPLSRLASNASKASRLGFPDLEYSYLLLGQRHSPSV